MRNRSFCVGTFFLAACTLYSKRVSGQATCAYSSGGRAQWNSIGLANGLQRCTGSPFTNLLVGRQTQPPNLSGTENDS